MTGLSFHLIWPQKYSIFTRFPCIIGIRKNFRFIQPYSKLQVAVKELDASNE